MNMNWLIPCSLTLFLSNAALAEDLMLHRFERQQLTDLYFSEGANAGDLNRDGHADIVCGPYWFAGPDFLTKHAIYKPVPQDVNRYADNFFSWIYDFNADGWNDVFVVGFPGTPAYVYENPKTNGFNQHWTKHQVIDWVSNESPQFVDMFDDERPELVCTRDGFFGFATIDSKKAFGEWSFHPISEQLAASKFGHGLGVGDVNDDGLMDVIHSGGWFEQPTNNADNTRWRHHEVSFSESYGGAEMYAYDVDGDGDNDVITSHAAHEFGLGWYEQVIGADERLFKHHLIMGDHPSQNKYGVLFSELHSVNLADIDGDGLKDIVTGKTYWSHHTQSPMWNAGAVVYWFKLVRNDDGVDWIPFQADTEAGIGRQLTVTDLNADGLLDFVVGGMKGAHVLTHKATSVAREQWQAAQPTVYVGEKLPTVENAQRLRGPKSTINVETGQVAGAIEGESAKWSVSAGTAKPQAMGGFSGDKWSGNSQLWWSGAQIADTLTVELPEFSGEVEIEAVLTCARDYGIVQLSLDNQPLGDPVDCYDPNVVTTGVLSFSKLRVPAGKHTLSAQIVGSNPKAKKSLMFALDYVRVKLADGTWLAN